MTVELPALDKHQSNSATVALFQLGRRTVKQDVLSELVFAHLLNEEFFHQLRTRVMLGYIVFCSVLRDVSTHDLVCVVQTPSHLYRARDVALKIDHFTKEFVGSTLQQLGELQLQQLVGAIIGVKNVPPANPVLAAARVCVIEMGTCGTCTIES